MKRRIEQIERLSSLTVRRGHSHLGPIAALGQRVVLTGDDARVHLSSEGAVTGRAIILTDNARSGVL